MFFERIAKPQKRCQVLAVVTHIVRKEEARDSEIGRQKIQRLSNVIDGLLSSLAHCDLKIVLNTSPNMNVIAFLPSYMQERIVIRETVMNDPMLIEFYAQDIMIEQQDEFDWFLFLEDDIVIRDSSLLEKYAFFNACFGKHDLLMPNRYEMYNGVKMYIDITIDFARDDGKPHLVYLAPSTVDVGGVVFSENANPHAGFYCLNKEQLKAWIKGGRHWYKAVVGVGPLESAATFCLFESFNLYKPHSSNLHFAEVYHFDTKYSKAGHCVQA